MKLWLAAALLAALFGCATAPPETGGTIQMGGEVAAPWGFDDLCRREPERIECGAAR